jgi:hypothetical protein
MRAVPAEPLKPVTRDQAGGHEKNEREEGKRDAFRSYVLNSLRLSAFETYSDKCSSSEGTTLIRALVSFLRTRPVRFQPDRQRESTSVELICVLDIQLPLFHLPLELYQRMGTLVLR